MRRECVRVMGVLMGALVCAGVVLAQGTGGGAAGGVAMGKSGVAGLVARLEGLSPDDPMSYFELAEEVSYEMEFGAGQDLARRLFVLAFELDRELEEPLGLGGSVCLALADMSTDVNEQRWLQALAEALEGSMRDVRWVASLSSGGSDRAPLDLAGALGRLRAGDVRKIRTLTSRFDVVRTFREAGMKADEAGDFVSDVGDQMRRMRGRSKSREVRKTVDATLVVELDDTSGGNPGPSLSGDEYLEHLRAEMLLVKGRSGSWASQVLLDSGVPLRDIDPAELAPYFGVDPARCVFRVGEGGHWMDGRWEVPRIEGETSD